MTRTRPGSIIRQCVDGQYHAWRSSRNHTVRRVAKHYVLTDQGFKIRSWIVVKE
jgi:hypothetical protein